ncbi:MAG: hypothetical protein LBV16_07535 [Elusimicrobiota bacterium]|jgi:hypothetical protein|nr:hypothetical protein [Elusimicrobiota bacterium]
MKLKKIAVISAAFLLYAPLVLSAQEIVNISFDKESAFVGDIINIKIKAELPQNASISANQTIRFDNFDILSSDIKHISSNPNIYEIDFKAGAFKTGILQIEPAAVFYINPDGTNNIFFTPQSQFEIKSIVGQNANAEIKDIKPLEKLPIKKIWLLLILVIIAGIVLIGIPLCKEIVILYKKSKEPVLSLKELSLNALSELYYSPVKKDEPRIFYYRMSEILRNYISQEYNFDAMEMTNSEFFEAVKKTMPDTIDINEFRNYLKIFTLAQYAAFKPSDKENENSFNYTKELLEKL